MIQVLTEIDNRSYHEVPVQTVVVLTFGYQSVETLPVLGLNRLVALRLFGLTLLFVSFLSSNSPLRH